MQFEAHQVGNAAVCGAAWVFAIAGPLYKRTTLSPLAALLPPCATTPAMTASTATTTPNATIGTRRMRLRGTLLTWADGRPPGGAVCEWPKHERPLRPATLARIVSFFRTVDKKT